MLAKNCWRILSNPDSLISLVLKHKYFSNCYFLEASKGGEHLFFGLVFYGPESLLVRGSVGKLNLVTPSEFGIITGFLCPPTLSLSVTIQPAFLICVCGWVDWSTKSNMANITTKSSIQLKLRESQPFLFMFFQNLTNKFGCQTRQDSLLLNRHTFLLRSLREHSFLLPVAYLVGIVNYGNSFGSIFKGSVANQSKFIQKRNWFGYDICAMLSRITQSFVI